ncbi:MAG: hypothetical protein KJO38_01850, partial [Gammaproteobacteria bacterium]|nr:hypothetical protein [Gammaproteobacteria bacterium]
PQTLPDLVPASFPANGSGTDADESDSPFVSATAVYYDKITIDKNESATFMGGGPFHIDELEVKDGGQLNLSAGTYFINKLDLKKDVTLIVDSEPVFIHIGDEAKIDDDSQVNAGGAVSDLVFFLHEDAKFTLSQRVNFTGVVFGPQAGEIKIEKESTVRGAFVTPDKVKIAKDVTITYTDADRAAVNGITTCPEGVDHFAIAHDGAAVNCQAEPVTISAHADDDSVDTSFTGVINLSTSGGNGDWSLLSGAGTLTNSGGGAASYGFAAADNGQVVLALKNTVAETVNINVVSGGTGESAAEDPDLAFAAAGFQFLAGGVPGAIGTQIAVKPSNLAPGAQLLELQAIDTNTTTGACEAALSGSVAVELAFECLDPGVCGAALVNVNGTPTPGNPAASVTAYTPVTLDFGDTLDTTAPLVIAYPDAGRIRLHARYDIPLASGAPSGDLLLGPSNAFVLRPFGFAIDFSGDRAANGTAGVSYAADAAGSRFVKAGENFATTIRAVGWSAADDGNADGVPDAGANLYDNSTTPAFGAEAVPATVDATHALVLPAPGSGSPGVLTGGSGIGGFGAGAATAPLSWSEVGIIDLSVIAIDYLASGANAQGTVRNVGRFYPARLSATANVPVLRSGTGTWSCPFTYLDQPFGFGTDPVITITALSAGGGVTQNYGGAFWKYTAAPYLAGRSYTNQAATTALLDAPNIGTAVLTGETDFDGAGLVTISGEQFAYQRGAAPIEPFAPLMDLDIPAADLVDSDGVCFDAGPGSCNTNDGDPGAGLTVAAIDAPAGETLRFGRLRLANALGSELLPLTLPFALESFSGGAFAVNTDDSCSSVAIGFIDLLNDVSDPAPGVDTIALGAATTTASLGAVAAGLAPLTLSAPGAGNTGYVDVTFDLSPAGAGVPWLQYDWDGDGAFDDDPTARGAFGLYSGPRSRIYQREPWR